MSSRLIHASASAIRQTLLAGTGLRFDTRPARVDEAALRDSMLAEAASPRDVADGLAELKALKVSQRFPAAIVIGCDQVLSLDGRILSKPHDLAEAREKLLAMRGKQHELLSAAVVCEGGKPVWRHVGVVRMTMRPFSDAWIDGYLDRNWDSVRHAVGVYKLEEEGVRLFSRIEGDYFTVLGLPLLDLLSYLTLRGEIDQ